MVEGGSPGNTNDQPLRAVAPGGEIALIGFLTTDKPGVDLSALQASEATIRNMAVSNRMGLLELTRIVTRTPGLEPKVEKRKTIR